ncbi:MAG TPA: hypothetical protein VKG80_20440 [Trebonia sp.]|nr:hypothetical protein [Trebonia sp.]
MTPPPVSFATTVDSLGSRYPAAFAGLTATPTRSETIAPTSYVLSLVRAQAGPFMAAFTPALRRADARAATRVSVTVRYVQHSWAQLSQLTNHVASAWRSWQARGIDVAKVEPDVTANKVLVTLKRYRAAAAAALVRAYGAGTLTVSTASLPGYFKPLDRYTDTPPFWGGDRLYYAKSGGAILCTSGFVTLGNAHPGNHWILTAGHCGENTFYTNASNWQTVGSTSTDYMAGYGGSTTIDVQTIGPASAWGAVWENGDNYAVPYDTLYPGEGQQITFDGSMTGMVTNNPVTDPGPFCLLGDETADGETYCGLGEAENPEFDTICQGGDSGGPVFQRTSSSTSIQAVGLVSLGYVSDTGLQSYDCVYTLLSYPGGGALSTSNTHLDTNPTG